MGYDPEEVACESVPTKVRFGKQAVEKPGLAAGMGRSHHQARLFASA